MAIIIKVFGELGVPLAPDNIEGPSTCLPYLGICIDSIKMEIRVPEYKPINLCTELHSWHDYKKMQEKRFAIVNQQAKFCS